jgi:DNA-binding winged helix-turn-helix (wHTH) protein
MSMRCIYESDGLLVSVAERRLRFGALEVPIKPLCFDAMTYLIANRHRAVGRDELVSAVWGKVSLSSSAVPQCILRLRQTLRVSPAHAQAIRTVSRFGYQWVAPTVARDRS